MSEIFKWSTLFETGFDRVDDQHRRLVELINGAAAELAGDARSTPGRLVAMSSMVDELMSYAAHHFKDEEAMMEVRGLAPEFITIQKHQHREFVHEVQTMRAPECGKAPDPGILLGFLTSWLAVHILGTDQLMADQIRLVERGVSPERAWQEAKIPHGADAARPLIESMNALYEVISTRNRELEESNVKLLVAQAELAATNALLEARVAERTADLEREKAELATVLKQVAKTQSQLLQSEKMASIGQLAAGVAHEINNPIGFVNSNLCTLKTYVDKLLDLVDVYRGIEERLPDDPVLRRQLAEARERADLEFLCDDVRDLLRESQDGLGRVRRIISDLKDFSHVDEAEWQEADLNSGLESTLNVVWNELKYKAEVIRNFGELPLVRCVAAQINQIFMNLLINAAHAIESHGTISLTTRSEGNEVVVEIADTGKGIPPEILERIFEPFFTTKPVGKGTGLGLSIAWDIVEKHGGHLGVSSTVGEGTCFTLRLPIDGPPEAASAT